PRDIVDHFLTRSDGEMLEALEDVDPETLKIRERIRSAVKARIELHGGRKDAVGRTLAYLALPMNAALSARALWRTSDVIWRWAGDRATDYNHYTKRAILSAVYSSTLLYWLNDDSEDAEKTWGFLDRRIENVMQFEKLKAKVLCKTEKMPDIARRLGRLRYGK
ncbi:MAG: COQ9 family protein, partial [Sphingomonadales bacterium]